MNVWAISTPYEKLPVCIFIREKSGTKLIDFGTMGFMLFTIKRYFLVTVTVTLF